MKKFGILCLVLLGLLSNLTGLGGLSVKSDDDTGATSNFSVAAKSAIAVDAASGKILYDQNATDQTTPIASITKLLTAYLVYQAISEGKITLNTKFTISQYAHDLSENSASSGIPMAQGEKISVKELLNALLIPSANSAAVALAEGIAGSEPKFVDLMRAQMKAWGVTDATIVNASGLPNSILGSNIYPGSSTSATNTMSAEDVAIICMHLLQDYPQVLNVTKTEEAVFDQGGASQADISTTNQLLPGFATSRAGSDGLKTGSVTNFVDCFAGTTVQNGFRIITVILDINDPVDNTSIFTQTNNLMNQVYGTWQAYGIVAKGESLPHHETMSIMDAKEDKSNVVAKSDISVVVPMNDPVYSVKFDSSKGRTLVAPVKAGTVVAQATITVTDKNGLGYLPGFHATVCDFTVDHDVARANPFVVLWDHFVRFVNTQL
ncbi:MAG: D-alanyl-D-alanine carboxypeptidase [Streptococcaceae bacterium]|nr:D-alanyl-D-alanine carboxypeptidase [Streptococcaceae bacterium]